MFRAHNYFNIFSKKSLDEKVYDIVHIICFFAMILGCFLINHFFDDKYPLYISCGITIFFLVTMIEGNRSGNRRICSMIMVVVLNFFYLPLLFSTYGKFVSVIPFYFFIGIVYTLLVLDIKAGLILALIEVAFYSVFIYSFGVGIGKMYVIPTKSEFLNMYNATIAAFIFVTIFLGAVVRFKYLAFIRERDNAYKLHEESVQEYVARDMFLINMSHEIRTPMNAIVGNANLLLEEVSDNKVRDNIDQILNSCSALLLILNELMDLSKIDSQEVEVFDTPYNFKEMISEITNIVSVKLTESQLEFFVDMDTNIPRYMIGDVSKIRQLLINILSNAIKYTNAGYIELSVNYERISNEKINLIFNVKDTGIGMDEGFLDEFFSQNIDDSIIYLDDNSGLGLWTCKQLINKLGGKISAISEKGKGTTFSFFVPQRIDGNAIPVCELKNGAKVLLIEKNEFVANRIRKIFDRLNISCDIAFSRIELDTKLSNSDYTHIFVAHERFDECDITLQHKRRDAKIVFITDIGETAEAAFTSSSIIRPVNALNIISAINGEYDDALLNRRSSEKLLIPDVSILIVDDNYTNLDVASALLRKYDAKISTAPSGKDALRMMGEQDYDLVFMDYMMPDLNGIDTLNIIRSLPNEKHRLVPVVALSANVIGGAHEMFRQAGFDAFMPKPINVNKLEKLLIDLLPDEKIERV